MKLLSALIVLLFALLPLPDSEVATAVERGQFGSAPALADQEFVPCSADVDLPSAVRIDRTATGLPPELAAFPLGWEGTWSDQIPATLIVEQIDANYALVVYAWGDGQNRARGWTRTWARVLPGGKLTLGDETKLTFAMNLDRLILSGDGAPSGGLATITMTRCWPYSVSMP